MGDESEHYLFAASRAPRWRWCPASARLEHETPDNSGLEAKEGTATHECATALIKNGLGAKKTRVLAEGDKASNGIIITDEMFECALGYSLDVLETFSEHGVNLLSNNYVLENKYPCPIIHPGYIGGMEDCGGTADAGCLVKMPNGNYRLIVWELKSGFVVVDAFESEQMVVYTASLLGYQWSGLFNKFPGINPEVEFRVWQPKRFRQGGPLDKWVTTWDDLQPLINELKASAEAGFVDNPPCIPGKHCLRCKKRGDCGACQLAGFAAMDFALNASECCELSPENIAVEMKMIEEAQTVLKGRLTGLQVRADDLARSGTNIPGKSLEMQYTNLKWDVEPDVIRCTAEALEIDPELLFKPVETLTPSQSKKILGKGIVSCLASRKPKGLALVDTDESVFRLFKEQ